MAYLLSALINFNLHQCTLLLRFDCVPLGTHLSLHLTLFFRLNRINLKVFDLFLLSNQVLTTRVTSVEDNTHRAFVGLGVRKLHRDEGDDDQTESHLFEVQEDLFVEFDDVVLSVDEELGFEHEKVDGSSCHHEHERNET